MARIHAEGIHYAFGRQKVLRGVDLASADGECIALYGANGSGKSTLLTILATGYRPQRGSYRLDGLLASEEGSELRRRLVYVGHHTHLYGHLTPVENLRFFCDLRGLRPTTEALREAVAAVGLALHAERPVRGFSAGMRKRLALSRILPAKPALLLLDEPYSALDHAGVSWLNDLLGGYLRGGGTIILASHDPERVAPLSPQIRRLEEGRLIAEQTTAPRETP
ncbi:MAG: heme ABC exporter ATP-binding protein CcmA [Magnetococcales bacterium]|nr:heme ABC exporter ATP-binding protein CcmA [Magnetococcales bacterium]MBF0157671.1 heme ABC exporter ATP-binding protein CcmA [Magnetococcales bacterium]